MNKQLWNRISTNCAINIKVAHYDIINIKEVHLNRITCCQGWNKSGRCQAPQSFVSDPASTFPGPGHHIKLGTWQTCQAVKSNLIKRIVPGPSGGEFPVCRRGAEISWNVVNASDSLLQLYVSTLHTHKDNLMSGKSDSTTSDQQNPTSQPVPYSFGFVGFQQVLHSVLPDMIKWSTRIKSV